MGNGVQIRNQRMFELGYDVMRFWVYEVRDDLPGCLERIKAWRSNIQVGKETGEGRDRQID